MRKIANDFGVFQLDKDGTLFKFVPTPHLEELVIPHTVREIFSLSCNTLKSITIPDSVKAIKYGMFWGCDALEKVVLQGATEIEIGPMAFLARTNLKSIIIFTPTKTIGGRAFMYCKALESVNLPNTIKVIEKNAFWGCSALKSIAIPDSVTEIGDGAFCGCMSLESITIPDSVTRIGDGAFYGCSALKNVVIPNPVKEIGARAFAGCSSLTLDAEGRPI